MTTLVTVTMGVCAGPWWRLALGVSVSLATLGLSAGTWSPGVMRSPADTGATALSSGPGRASGASAATRDTAASSVTSRITAAPGRPATATGQRV